MAWAAASPASEAAVKKVRRLNMGFWLIEISSSIGGRASGRTVRGFWLSPSSHGDGLDDWLVVASEVENLVDPVVVLDLVRVDVLRVEHSAVNDHQPVFWRGRR